MKNKNNKQSIYAILLMALMATASFSCSKDDDSSGPSGPSETETAISGQLLAPDQKTPIAGALVYVSTDAAGKSSNSSSGNADCDNPGSDNLGYACTDAEGNFYFKVTATEDTKKLNFSAGAFAFSQDVELNGGKTIELENLALPVNSGKIAVVEGSYDRMQDVLAKIGFAEIGNNGLLVPGTENFDLFNSTDPLFEDADADGKKDIFNYDIIFINCGTSEGALAGKSPKHTHNQQNAKPFALNGENKDAIKTFVEQGGTLYATDWAYDYVEQVFPSYIDFLGSDETPIGEPEDNNVAQSGNGGLEVEGAILESTMASWFAYVDCDNGGECLNSNGSISITDFLSAWAVMDGVGPQTTVWVEGEVEYNAETGTKPLTVSFHVGEGTVIYSSYHTIESAHSEYWRPQERILQYLVFE